MSACRGPGRPRCRRGSLHLGGGREEARETRREDPLEESEGGEVVVGPERNKLPAKHLGVPGGADCGGME